MVLFSSWSRIFFRLPDVDIELGVTPQTSAINQIGNRSNQSVILWKHHINLLPQLLFIIINTFYCDDKFTHGVSTKLYFDLYINNDQNFFLYNQFY